MNQPRCPDLPNSLTIQLKTKKNSCPQNWTSAYVILSILVVDFWVSPLWVCACTHAILILGYYCFLIFLASHINKSWRNKNRTSYFWGSMKTELCLSIMKRVSYFNVLMGTIQVSFGNNDWMWMTILIFWHKNQNEMSDFPLFVLQN